MVFITLWVYHIHFWYYVLPISALLCSIFIYCTVKHHFYSHLFFCCFLLSVLLVYLCLKPHSNNIQEPTAQTPLKISYIQESKTQLRLSLKDPDNHKLLAIYYKPKVITHNTGQFNFMIGKLIAIRTTKTQLKLTLKVKNTQALVTIRKKNSQIPLPSLQNGILIYTQTPTHKYFKKLNPNKKSDLAKIKKGLTYTAYVKEMTIVEHKTPEIGWKSLNTFNIQDFKVGDFISVSPQKSWKIVKPFSSPFYLFAQGFSLSSSIKSMTKMNQKSSLSIIEWTTQKLMTLYKTSAYPSFYWSVLLGKKPLDKDIYNLFQKSELVHLLVISGSHIEIIISFFMFILSFFFALLFFIKQPHHIISYLKEIRFFSIRAKSKPLFIILCVILIFYLLLTDSQQAGARAIFSFIIAGFLYHLGLRISVYILLGLSIMTCFIIYPEWINYPVGLLYSSTAVLSLYLCLPLVFKLLFYIKSNPLKWIISSICTSALVSLFIAPLSFYFFHYYNFISIFTNIPMAILFFIFIYLASLGSILGLIYPSLGTYILSYSDICIQGMLNFLKMTQNIYTLKFYIHYPINLIALSIFYIVIIILIQELKKYLKIKEIKT